MGKRMKKFKAVYLHKGKEYEKEIEAVCSKRARYWFDCFIDYDKIISITELTKQ